MFVSVNDRGAARMVVRPVMLLAALAACGGTPKPAVAPSPTPAAASSTASAAPVVAPPTNNYWVYVGAESADLIHRIRFGPGGTVVEKTIPVGELATEMEGPHGLQISKDGKYLHMTTGHGSPDGKYWKFELGPDTLVGKPIFLGYFPATLDVTPDGMYAFAANFNLHGEMVPSSISVVYTPTNTEVAQITTCTMPHGSRLDPKGLHHYSGCMMDDQLVEIDATTFKVSRRFSVAKGKEGPVPVAAVAEHAGHDMATMQGNASGGPHVMPPASCSPTWAQPSIDGSKIYVTCNKADEILEVDRDAWAITRRIKTGMGPYNLAVTPDGKYLLATLKKAGAFEVYDLATGASVMQMKNSTTLANGIAVSADSRYAFVSSEGVGAAPGKVDVYDLKALTRVGTADVGQQAGGIAFWRQEPAK